MKLGGSPSAGSIGRCGPLGGVLPTIVAARLWQALEPVNAQKQIRWGRVRPSADDFVRPQQERVGKAEAQRLRSLEIDDELELRRPPERKLAGFRAPENAIDVLGDDPVFVDQARRIG